MCVECAKKQNERARKLYAARAKQKVCLRCRAETEAGKQHCPKCLARYSDRERLARFNLTPQQFADMRLKQENKCGICAERFTKTPQVDHDHQTLRVRELLCGGCNRMIGDCGESVDILLAGIRYLSKYSGMLEVA